MGCDLHDGLNLVSFWRGRKAAPTRPQNPHDVRLAPDEEVFYLSEQPAELVPTILVGGRDA